MEGVKSQVAENKSEICPWRIRWDICAETNLKTHQVLSPNPSQISPKELKTHQIRRPEIEIPERSNETTQSDGLSIIHIAFGGIVAQKSVHHYLLFVFREPAFTASSAGGLARTGWHGDPGGEAYAAGYYAFDEESG